MEVPPNPNMEVLPPNQPPNMEGPLGDLSPLPAIPTPPRALLTIFMGRTMGEGLPLLLPLLLPPVLLLLPLLLIPVLLLLPLLPSLRGLVQVQLLLALMM